MREDGGMLAEITVLGVIQAVLDEFSHKHLNPPRTLPPPSQVVRGHTWIPLEFFNLVLREMIRPLLPRALHGCLNILTGTVALQSALLQGSGLVDGVRITTELM